jgi:excisionase family DNA binding protein
MLNSKEPEALFVSPPQVAVMLAISRAKAYHLIASGEIPSIKIGHSLRVPLSALRAMAASAAKTAVNDG